MPPPPYLPIYLSLLMHQEVLVYNVASADLRIALGVYIDFVDLIIYYGIGGGSVIVDGEGFSDHIYIAVRKILCYGYD